MSGQVLKLENRGVLALSGSEALDFLNALVTNDLKDLAAHKGVYAALLTPQGKFLYDMFVWREKNNPLDIIWLDVEKASIDALKTRLQLYKLRRDVKIEDKSADYSVFALWNMPASAEGERRFSDPRHPSMGERLIAQNDPQGAPLSLADYEHCRMSHGIPDSSRDMKREQYFWLETNAEALSGVSFKKGCYIGQELTSRMKYRTPLKKLILPVQLERQGAVEDSPILTGDGKPAGTLLSVQGQIGLAYIKLERRLEPLFAGDIAVYIREIPV